MIIVAQVACCALYDQNCRRCQRLGSLILEKYHSHISTTRFSHFLFSTFSEPWRQTLLLIFVKMSLRYSKAFKICKIKSRISIFPSSHVGTSRRLTCAGGVPMATRAQAACICCPENAQQCALKEIKSAVRDSTIHIQKNFVLKADCESPTRLESYDQSCRQLYIVRYPRRCLSKIKYI